MAFRATQPHLSPLAAPQLAPGLRVVRRGLHHLQVGLYAGRRVVLPRTGPVETVLARLLAREPLPDSPETADVLGRLEERGCLSEHPFDARPLGRVAVDGRLAAASPRDVEDLLCSAGLRTVASPARAEAVIVLSEGELPRERLDPLVRRQTSHVVVRLVDGGAVLGPFVVPGRTACLRCVDAHELLHDPDLVAVTARYVRACARPRPDGVPDVVDPMLGRLALTWAVRDVAAYLVGREPSTWSRTMFWDAEPARRTERVWRRHPACGCSWSADAHLSGTMGG